MDFWTVVRTVLEKNPGMKAKQLLQELAKKTGLRRSAIYSHLESLWNVEKIFREKGKYYLPCQWSQKGLSNPIRHYDFPKLDYGVTQHKVGFPGLKVQMPRVGFNLKNVNDYPVRVRIKVRMFLAGRDLGLIRDQNGYYNDGVEIPLNPGKGYKNGSFAVTEECTNSSEKLTLQVSVLVIDPENVEHRLLPMSWTYKRKENDWNYEPRGFVEEQWAPS